MLEKCESRFQQELDVNTIIKRLRFSYNSLSQLKNKELKKYLRLHRSNVICETDSEDREYDFEVGKSYFSSSDDDPSNPKKKSTEEFKTSEFTKNVQASIRESLIQGMNIPNSSKNQILTFRSNLA